MTSDTVILTDTRPSLTSQVVLDALPYGVAICERNGRVLQCNEELARMMGVARDRMVNHKAGFLSPGLLGDMDAAFVSGRPWRGDIVFLNARQEKMLCEMSIAAIDYVDHNQTCTALLLSLLENNSRQLAERSLIEQRQDRVDVNASKSDFLANMGHELRTPLNAIIGNSELIAEGVLGPLSQNYRDCAQDVLDAGRHLLALVNDVLDVSKLSEGAMKLRSMPDDVVAITHEAARIVMDDIKKRHHHFEISLPDGPLMVNCDRLKLKQILINILSNATKFTPDGGEIHLSLEIADDEIIFIINDNGVGMSPDDIPRAMMRYSQLHPTGVKESEGTGLGLPLAKLLTELHGGRIGIDSLPGQGTTVKIHLPR
ncbi:MAG: PAS domain-containing sensor histidine kinase [Pseudomonadota bacterium]